MSYIVLARKWRPKQFGEVVGQEHITTTLLNSMRSGRTAHAYLFVGPRGIGKTTTARIFAKALNCTQPHDAEPCGECDACRQIDQGRSIDVIEIDGASNNSVEDIRMLRENVKIAPAALKYKVYIIDEVHMLSTAAFNAFLKTLEEPPEHVKFILATTEAQKIPTTVLSRCQRFDFRRLTSRQIFKRLKEIVADEGIEINERALFAIARATEGSMRDALGILDQLVSFSEQEISLDDVHALLGTVGQDVYHRVALAIGDGDSALILKTVNDVIDRGKDLSQFLKELTLYFRNLLVASYGAGEELIDLPEEDLSALKELGARFKQADLIKMVQDFSELESRFRLLPSGRVALEMLLMRMSEVGAEISIDSVLSKLATLEKRLKGSGSNPGSAPPPPAGQQMAFLTNGGVAEDSTDTYVPTSEEAPEEVPDEVADEVREEPEPSTPPTEGGEDPQLSLWNRLLNEIQEQSMSIYSFLTPGRFCGVENGQMIVCFKPAQKYNKAHLEKKDIRMLLEETLKTIANTPLKIKMIIEDEDAQIPSPQKEGTIPSGIGREGPDEAGKERLAKALSNPIVKKAMELFNGKIVYVSG